MKNYFYSLLLICTTFSCSKPTAINQVDVNSLQPDSLIRLHEWIILAPFYPDSNVFVLDRIQQDLLADYGHSENEISEMNDFLLLGKDISTKDTSVFFKQMHIPYHIFDLEKIFEIKPPMTAYLACNIESTENCQVALNISAYQSAIFWLNGEEIYTIEWKRGRNTFREDFVPISLKKGTNFLLLKLSVSDKNYVPAQWKIEADISDIETAKQLFTSCYSKHFIRNSLIEKGESLNLYTGAFSLDEAEINLYKKNDSSMVLLQERAYANMRTGDIRIDLSSKNLEEGVYTCKLIIDKNGFEQDFFIGDIDIYLDNLKQEYAKLEHLTTEQKLNVNGIIRRTHMDVRRKSTDFDDQAEYWNRLRIPSIVQLEYAIGELKNKKNPLEPYFLRSYYSDFWKGYNYYSAYLPFYYRNTANLPVFILLIDSETETRNWEAHYRNTLSSWLLDTRIMADELGFIAIWTDCGGRIDINDKLKLFDEIVNNVCENLPVDRNKIFIIGNCASTNMSLTALNKFAERISGCGLINPSNASSAYFVHSNRKHEHKLTMIYAEHDETIPSAVSLSMFENLKMIDPSATIYKCSLSSHGNAPSSYSKPLYLDLLFRTRH